MPRVRFCKDPWTPFERTDGTHSACYCAEPNHLVNGQCIPPDPGGEFAMLRDAVDVIFGNARNGNGRARVRRLCIALTASAIAGYLVRVLWSLQVVDVLVRWAAYLGRF